MSEAFPSGFRLLSVRSGKHAIGTLPGMPSEEVRVLGEKLARRFHIPDFDLVQVPFLDDSGPRVAVIVALAKMEVVSQEARPLVLRPRYPMDDDEIIAAARAMAERLGVLNPAVRIRDGIVEVFEG